MNVTFRIPKLENSNYNQTETIWQLATDLTFESIIYSKRTDTDLYIHMANIALVDDNVYYARAKRIADGEEDDDWVGPTKILPGYVNNLAVDIRPEAYVEPPLIDYEFTDTELIVRTGKIRAGNEAHLATSWILTVDKRKFVSIEDQEFLTEKRYNLDAIGYHNSNHISIKVCHHSSINSVSPIVNTIITKKGTDITLEGNKVSLDPKSDHLFYIKDNGEDYTDSIRILVIDTDTGLEVINKEVSGGIFIIPKNILKPEKTYLVDVKNERAKNYYISTREYWIPEFKYVDRKYNNILKVIDDFPADVSGEMFGWMLPGDWILAKVGDDLKTYKFVNDSSFIEGQIVSDIIGDIKAYCNGLNGIFYTSSIDGNDLVITKCKIHDVTGEVVVIDNMRKESVDISTSGRFLQFDYVNNDIKTIYYKNDDSFVSGWSDEISIVDVDMPEYAYLTKDGKLIGLTKGENKKFIMIDLNSKDYAVIRTLSGDYDQTDFAVVRRLNDLVCFLPKQVAGSYLTYNVRSGAVNVVSTNSIFDWNYAIKANDGSGLFIKTNTCSLFI